MYRLFSAVYWRILNFSCILLVVRDATVDIWRAPPQLCEPKTLLKVGKRHVFHLLRSCEKICFKTSRNVLHEVSFTCGFCGYQLVALPRLSAIEVIRTLDLQGHVIDGARLKGRIGVDRDTEAASSVVTASGLLHAQRGSLGTNWKIIP